jgi:hypothetical protein
LIGFLLLCESIVCFCIVHSNRYLAVC